MKILLTILALLLASPALACEHHPRERNVNTTVNFCLRGLDGLAKTDATFSAGHVKVMIDEGAENNIGTLPVDEGRCYSVAVDGSEIAGKRTLITIINDASYYPKCLVIETYGDSTAQHDIPDSNVIEIDGVATDAVDELAAVPGASPSFMEMVQWLYQLTKHAFSQTEDTATTYKADGTTELGTADVSDDNTTFERTEYQ